MQNQLFHPKISPAEKIIYLDDKIIFLLENELQVRSIKFA